MIERADGTLAYADIGTLPTGGGGEANTISGAEAQVDLIHSSGKQGIDLRLVDLATADFSVAADIVSILDSKWAKDSELHTQSHALDSGTDHTGTLPDADLEDMLANTIVMRNAGTTGVRADVKISGLTEEVAPTALDWVLGEDAAGNLRKYDVGNLPGGGGSLGSLSDVDLTTPTTGATLIKSAGNWVDGPLDLSLAAAVGSSILAAANIADSISRDSELTTHTAISTAHHTAALLLAGGTMAGDIAMGGFDITGVGVIEMNAPAGTGVSQQTWKEGATHGAQTLIISGPSTGWVTTSKTCTLIDSNAPYDGCVTPNVSTIFELDTLTTGAELTELTDQTDADHLHTHAGGAHTRLHALDDALDHSGTLPDADLADMAANTIMLRETGAGARTDQRIFNLSDEPAPAALDFILIERADGTLARADIGDLPGGGGLWTDLVGAVVPATTADDVLVGSADATCSAGEICLDVGDVSVTADVLISRPVSIPMWEFDDLDFSDASPESRITADATSANDGRITLEVEELTDGAYFDGVDLYSTAGVVVLDLMRDGGTAYIKIAEGGVMTAEGAASIDATTGDSADGFFDAGLLDAAFGGTDSDSSSATGVPLVTAGSWTYDADLNDLAASTGGIDDNDLAAGAVDGGSGGEIQDGTIDSNDLATANKTHEVCMYLADPVTAEQLETVWRAPVAITATEIYCETDAGTVGFDFNNDDDTPTGVNGSDISCASTGTTDSSFAGDAAFAAGDRLDIDVGTVATAVQVSFCLRYTID